MKWQPVAAMLLLVGLALWLVLAGEDEPITVADGARAVQVRIGTGKGWLEVRDLPDGGHEFRMIYPGESAPAVLRDDDLRALLGERGLRLATQPEPNWAFRVLNISGWGGVAWVVLGFVGQALFFARMLVQWVASERRRESVVPIQFWWFSLLGGLMLFAYFIWRRDIVGVLGQTTGVVVYARNLRLIYRRR